MHAYIQVVTTTGNRQDAEKIAGMLVDRKLAGCVQIISSVMSIYRWKGHIETAEECQCVIKSRKDLYGAIEAVIKSMHPYETPEIIALPIIAGSRDYLEWLENGLIEGSSSEPH